MKNMLLSFLLSLSTMQASAMTRENCAESLNELATLVGNSQLNTKWQETTANDGKPLIITLSDLNDHLHLTIVKGGKPFGPGAGDAIVCERDHRGNLTATMKGQKVGMNFLASNRLKVSVSLWSGQFQPIR